MQAALTSNLSNLASDAFEALQYKSLLERVEASSDLPPSLDLTQQYETFLKTNSAKAAFKKTLAQVIVKIDCLINAQINLIIHQERFQALEASWRALRKLIEHSPAHPLLKIKLLNLSWQILAKDLSLAIEFDQSAFFQKIYSEEFDQSGGEPFGLLIGDYYISHLRKEGEIYHPLEVLKGISKVAAAAFVPFIAAASPELLELDSYDMLEPWIDLSRFFKKDIYQAWQRLREDEDSCFLGLILPRVLGRLPYRLTDKTLKGFFFQESITSKQDYLWSNPAYCFAQVVIRSYCTNAWFMDIKGALRDQLGKGVVTDLVVPSYELDRHGTIHKPFLETKTTASQEFAINQFGLMVLSECPHTPYAAFFDCSSLKKPDSYEKTVASVNAKLATRLPHVLCCARFAHYIKVIMRDKIGLFTEAKEIEQILQQWLITYAANIDNLSLEAKMKYPLREVQVQVREQLAKPGSYFCIVHLRPHFQVYEIDAKFSLTMELR